MCSKHVDLLENKNMTLVGDVFDIVDVSVVVFPFFYEIQEVYLCFRESVAVQDRRVVIKGRLLYWFAVRRLKKANKRD